MAFKSTDFKCHSLICGMKKLEKLQKRANKAIRLLRRQKHRKELPFMINSDMLETEQCFLEFPDGIIKIVEADKVRIDFKVVFEFSRKDSNALKKRFGLI